MIMLKNKINAFAGIISIIYFFTLSFPILKSMFSTEETKKTIKKEKWVEEPMLI